MTKTDDERREASRERQKAFRDRSSTTTKRLNTPLSLEAGQALNLLATRWNLTKRAALERLLLEAIQNEHP